MLPRYDHRSEKTDEAAGYGTLAHWWKETGESNPLWASDADIQLLADKLDLTDLDRHRLWPPDRGEHEVSFAIHLATGKLELFHGLRQHAEVWKAKWNPKEYLTGTIDWVSWGAESAWVDDLKTGKWPVDPVGNKQLKSYALVPWLKAGCPTKYRVHVSITQWPKYPKWKKPTRAGCELTALDLAEHLDDLRYAAAHPEEVNPEPIYEGPFDPERPLSICAFCPCRAPLPYSDWMHNYRYRAEQHCTPGLVKRIRMASAEHE